MTRQDGMLHWGSVGDGNWRAWAPDLYPDDKMPPYYRLTKVVANKVWRRIDLYRPRGEPGAQHVEIGSANTLSEAKLKAQEDYEQRQVHEHLKQT